ncbi:MULTISPECIES: hypothetical protein [Mycobacteriaceae]|jgi:hypothetical protein|uniref:Integrase catalytic domain-containing protein n=3 Tax=Mycobacterium TaxID=1763 RepID=D5P1Y0_9MYCO|nr:transposase [Mycobacterium intracellulare subsp. chimaera]EFG79921.1 hypothetical protein HMPREF0591_0174 [Mycobacterium parascrofulaceum ATCC BAA-614]ETZ40659.1 hypothetical protein L842_5630 [Mycobacterium intracellulare MIN_052511_1280]KRQ44233.1 hypothetical protein AOT92_06125 [Mycobacteroides sp. H101]KRQ53121.1 hypothetical protein AOT94_26465 [Mycobacteroides sp. HXVII]KRQ69606.1 hypothetical protein AOT90_00340 [Mycobacteroides sp. H079]KRQ85172.1 hypothetical protein AOT95_00370 
MRLKRVWLLTSISMAPLTAARSKIVSIIDEHTRKCVDGRVARGITGEDLVLEFDRLARQRDTRPTALRWSNDQEPNSFVGHWTIPDQNSGLDPLPQAGTPAALRPSE